MLNHERTRFILDIVSTIALVVAASTLTYMTFNAQPQVAAAGAGGSPVESVDVTVTGQGQVKGAKTAKVAILEFSDYQCPFCAQFAKNTLPQLEREFISPGVVQFGFRNNPLETIHPFAVKASAAAECAGQQSKYWEMHDALFARQPEIGEQLFTAQATDLRLDLNAFTACLDGTEVANRIKDDQQEATRLGLTSTPIFLVGRIKSDGTLHLTKRINGAAAYDVFKKAITELM